LQDVNSSSTSNLFSNKSSSTYQLNYDIPQFTTPNNPFDHLFLKTEPHIAIEDKLRPWILHFKVPNNCVNNLLNILNCEGLNLSNDVQTLMKTPKIHEISNIGNGNYTHLRLKTMLQPILIHFKCHISTTLKLGINIDGLPISKSSKSQLWPILISITNCKLLSKFVLPIGIYHGTKKPKCVNEFFNPFIIELLALLNNCLCCDGIVFKFEVSHFVCDALAKAFLLNVKRHNAYFGCNSNIESSNCRKINHNYNFFTLCFIS